ncbi:MAG: NupC/NupG family nucleoside CNT transporter [Flavobacteriales bacterium]
MRSKLRLVYSVLALFCLQFAHAESLTELNGTWSFLSITNDSTAELVFSVNTETDFLIIDSKKAEFFYGLESKQLKTSGQWKVEDNKIIFSYLSPKDTVRTYDLVQVGKTLKLKEGGLTYKFQKRSDFLQLKDEASSSSMHAIRGILGIFVLLAIAYAFSVNRKKVNWKLVAKGLGMQFIFALLVLKVGFIEQGFQLLSSFFVHIIDFTNAGTDFLFKSFITNKIESGLINFCVKVLPTIIFFSALSSLMYYWGILQKVVFVLAWIMKRSMGLSGAESLSSAGNIFLGQTESPFLVKPFIGKMTESEVMCLMTGGMATIAGGVMAAFIEFLGGGVQEQAIFFAKHLLIASIMSAPAAIVAAKILVPETETFDDKLEVSNEQAASNALEAVSNGTTDGVKLAVNVGAMLLVFTSLMAMGNYILEDIVGHYLYINPLVYEYTSFDALSFEMILGYLGAPIAWLVGVPWEDSLLVGQLLGEKVILNEFYAYKTLGEMKAVSTFSHERSIVLATYILCGFANFASIGIQIGGISILAPNQKTTLSKLGLRALIGGTLACLFTAAVVGVLI